MKNGSCSSIGKQPPMGLTLYFLYNSIVSSCCCCFFGSLIFRPLYFSLICLINGCSCCMRLVDLLPFHFSGNSAMLMTIVTSTIDQPQFATTLACVQRNIRNSGSATKLNHPKSTMSPIRGSSARKSLRLFGPT